MLHRLEVFAKLGSHGKEGPVQEKHLVRRVVQDVDHLFGREAWVDRVGHPPAAADPEVKLKMPPVVPRDSGTARAF